MAEERYFQKWNTNIKEGNKALGKLGEGNAPWLSAFKSNKFEIIQQREATFLPTHAHENAVKSFRGGTEPTFSNENLYGFSIFQYTGSFGNGWNEVGVESVLGHNVLGSLTGGDDIANIGSYFFNVNPKAIALSEPFTTQITPTQNAGYYIESQGIVLRSLTISGTTGYRPNIATIKTEEGTKIAPLDQNGTEATGYINHIRLRNLFRNYSDIKKDQSQTHRTYLVWYNGYTQEAWFCEPQAFLSSRDASSPFTTNYEISAVLLKKVSFSAISSSLAPFSFDRQFLLESMRLGGNVLQRDNLPGWLQSVANHSNDFLDVLFNVGTTIETANDLAHQAVLRDSGAVGTFAYLGTAVVTQLARVAFNFSQTLDLVTDQVELVTGNKPEFAEAFTEFGGNFQNIVTKTIRAYAQAVRISLDNGQSAGDLLQKDNEHYNGATGDLPAGDNFSFTSVTVPSVHNGINDFLKKNGVPLGWKNVFFKINGLGFPYFSNVPGPSVAAPGDTVLIPVAKKSLPNNVETILTPFNTSLPLWEEVLGRDIKISMTQYTTGYAEFNLPISDTGDLETIAGKENIKQAIAIKLNVPRGNLPMHPSFGVVDVVGMKGTTNLTFAAYLAFNDTMLSDGRVESISGMSIRLEGDIMHVYMKAHIIGQLPAVPVGFSLGA